MSRSKGPQINNTSRTFTTRDSVGIEGIANTISADLCPVVNTVTPRPYYWAFITWCYWKYYQAFGSIKDDEVREFIRRQNYFISLGNLIAGNNVVGGFTGITNIESRNDLQQESFAYINDYIAGIGAMGYYIPGLETMDLVTRQDVRNGIVVETFKEPHLKAPRATDLAEAFESVISSTEYYKQYLFENSVPRDVLKKLGNTVQIDMKGFDECKRLLIQYLFERDRLEKCKNYILWIKDKCGIEASSLDICRKVFFDTFSPRADNNELDLSLKDTSRGWEVLVARQYFTLALEVIWTYMMNQLMEPMTKTEWISCCINRQVFSYDINSPLSTIVADSRKNAAEIEQLFAEERSAKDKCSFERGLTILLSVYNRLNQRKDFNEHQLKYFDYGTGGSVSFNEVFKVIEDYKNRPIKDFLAYIMLHFLINQHLQTAFGKMLDNRDGYYIQEMDGKYIAVREFGWFFQGNRMVQLYSVMKDLDVI